MASDAGKSTGAAIAVAAIVVGAILLLVGIAGAAANWGSSTTYVVSPKPANSTTPTTPTTARAETASNFVLLLDNAVKNHDVAFLYARLHPAVIARYGEAACHAFVPRLSNRYAVSGPPATPAAYAYTSDGKTTQVPNVVAVPVRITMPDGATVAATLHTAQVNGTYRYFSDCTP